jgi:hypothetical protein
MQHFRRLSQRVIYVKQLHLKGKTAFTTVRYVCCTVKDCITAASYFPTGLKQRQLTLQNF